MTVSAYDEIAEWYDDSVNARSLIHDLVLPALLDLIGNVEGLRVCDLACGQGVVARQLAKSGAAMLSAPAAACRPPVQRRLGRPGFVA
jgi:ubiquinone/menaquinone biosynthesis C-methylase UbiE